jgi:hypothetical protein
MKLKGVNPNTPLDVYQVGRRDVWVKRDDLVGDNQITPPWGKLMAVQNLLKNTDLKKPVIHKNVFGSWSGWCLAYFAQKMDFEFHMAYPNVKKFPSELCEIVESFGCKLYPMRHNMANVLRSQVTRYAEEKRWQVLPVAFESEWYYNHMKKRIEDTIKKSGIKFDNLVVSSGSGVTCTALADGFFGMGGKNMYTICVSSEKTVGRKTQVLGKDENITVIKSGFAFDDFMTQLDVPFPCNQFWDRKAWHWLQEHIKTLKGKTLFWNLGGLWDF